MSVSDFKYNNLPISKKIDACIRDIDYNNEKDVGTITRLHMELLNWGPMARLGKLFLERFCYTILIKDELMKAAIAEVNGEPAGFIAYTDKSITFHRYAIRKHFWYVAYLIILSSFRFPRIIFCLPKAVWLMLSRRKEKFAGEDPQAEVLAIGVLPKYRNPFFVRRTGLRISRGLIEHAVYYFKSLGLKKMRLIVDADNMPALMFYHSLGGKFHKYELAGTPSILIFFDLSQLDPGK